MNTTGQDFAKMIRRNFGIGPRTRNRRDGIDIKRDMLDAIRNAATLPGYYSETKTEIFRAAWPAYLSYEKHIEGYRVAGELRYEIEKMTPWQFADFLGDMIDAGITNVGEGEHYFRQMTRDLHAMAA